MKYRAKTSKTIEMKEITGWLVNNWLNSLPRLLYTVVASIFNYWISYRIFCEAEIFEGLAYPVLIKFGRCLLLRSVCPIWTAYWQQSKQGQFLVASICNKEGNFHLELLWCSSYFFKSILVLPAANMLHWHE